MKYKIKVYTLGNSCYVYADCIHNLEGYYDKIRDKYFIDDDNKFATYDINLAFQYREWLEKNLRNDYRVGEE